MSDPKANNPWASEQAPAAPASPPTQPDPAEVAAAAEAEKEAAENEAAAKAAAAKPTVVTGGKGKNKTKVVIDGAQAPIALLNLVNSGMSVKKAKAKLGIE